MYKITTELYAPEGSTSPQLEIRNEEDFLELKIEILKEYDSTLDKIFHIVLGYCRISRRLEEVNKEEEEQFINDVILDMDSLFRSITPTPLYYFIMSKFELNYQDILSLYSILNELNLEKNLDKQIAINYKKLMEVIEYAIKNERCLYITRVKEEKEESE